MSTFDLAKTQTLAALFAEPRETQDDAWRANFYDAAADASLMSFDPQVQLGPDQFPYFQVAIPDAGAFTPFSVSYLLDTVLQNGQGIAIFGDSSRANGPQWVFTYGNLLSFRLFGSFEGDPAELARQTAASTGGGKHSVLVASPSENYLPSYARRAIGNYARRFFQMPHPKMALVDDPQGTPPRVLMINLTLADYHGDQRKLGAAMHYLSWFMPQTYRIVPMPPGWKVDGSFVSLE